MTKDEALKMALEALEDVQDMMSTSDWFNERVEVVRQALAEPDTGIDRGAWADVPDATKWVDELRGDDVEPPKHVDNIYTSEKYVYKSDKIKHDGEQQ